MGINVKVMNRGISLDQSLYTEGIVIEGMGSTDVIKVHTPLDPGIDLSARREIEEEWDSFTFSLCEDSWGNIMFLAGMTRPDISCNVFVNSVAGHHRLE